MDTRLKQRLVGATVLSALAVIFVPMIFDRSGSTVDTQDFDIPEFPVQIEQSSLGTPKETTDVESPVPPDAAAVPVQNFLPQMTRSSEKKESLTAWVIQVGSFNKTENADQLRDQLRKAGLPAYVDTGKKNGTVLFRVRVGPEIDQERARKQRDKIARKFNLEAIVLPIP